MIGNDVGRSHFVSLFYSDRRSVNYGRPYYGGTRHVGVNVIHGLCARRGSVLSECLCGSSFAGRSFRRLVRRRLAADRRGRSRTTTSLSFKKGFASHRLSYLTGVTRRGRLFGLSGRARTETIVSTLLRYGTKFSMRIEGLHGMTIFFSRLLAGGLVYCG